MPHTGVWSQTTLPRLVNSTLTSLLLLRGWRLIHHGVGGVGRGRITLEQRWRWVIVRKMQAQPWRFWAPWSSPSNLQPSAVFINRGALVFGEQVVSKAQPRGKTMKGTLQPQNEIQSLPRRQEQKGWAAEAEASLLSQKRMLLGLPWWSSG